MEHELPEEDSTQSPFKKDPRAFELLDREQPSIADVLRPYQNPQFEPILSGPELDTILIQKIAGLPDHLRKYVRVLICRSLGVLSTEDPRYPLFFPKEKKDDPPEPLKNQSRLPTQFSPHQNVPPAPRSALG